MRRSDVGSWTIANAKAVSLMSPTGLMLVYSLLAKDYTGECLAEAAIALGVQKQWEGGLAVD